VCSLCGRVDVTLLFVDQCAPDVMAPTHVADWMGFCEKIKTWTGIGLVVCGLSGD